MLDIVYIRNNPQEVSEKLARRGFDIDFTEFLEADAKRRAMMHENEELQPRARRTLQNAVYPPGYERFRRPHETFCQPLESARLDERQQQHAAGRQTETGVLRHLGQLFCQIYPAVRKIGHPRVGTFGTKRTHGQTNLGIVYVHRAGRDGFYQK